MKKTLLKISLACSVTLFLIMYAYVFYEIGKHTGNNGIDLSGFGAGFFLLFIIAVNVLVLIIANFTHYKTKKLSIICTVFSAPLFIIDIISLVFFISGSTPSNIFSLISFTLLSLAICGLTFCSIFTKPCE